MSRATAIAAMAAFLMSGCFPLDDPDDPMERAIRDARAAERGIVRRGRKRRWLLVKYWVSPIPVDEQRRWKDDASVHREKALGWKPVSEPSGPHRSILLKPGQSGFLAVARREPVGEFSLGGKSYGGGGRRIDRGFDISGVELSGGRVGITMTPVFRGLAEGGADLRVEANTFEMIVGPRATFAVMALDAGPGSAAGALFFDTLGNEKQTSRGLYVQVRRFR